MKRGSLYTEKEMSIIIGTCRTRDELRIIDSIVIEYKTYFSLNVLEHIMKEFALMDDMLN